jgi:hypothetical protein
MNHKQKFAIVIYLTNGKGVELDFSTFDELVDGLEEIDNQFKEIEGEIEAVDIITYFQDKEKTKKKDLAQVIEEEVNKRIQQHIEQGGIIL